jgi:hypothetical protein
MTLLEATVVLAVLGLAAALVVPRLARRDALALELAARRLADGLDYARSRAIFGGAPMRVVLDVDGGRWRLGRAARGPAAIAPGPSPLERPVVLPAGVRVAAVTVGGTVAHTGVAVVDLTPAGDALAARVDLADGRGRVVGVVLPPAHARAVVATP